VDPSVIGALNIYKQTEGNGENMASSETSTPNESSVNTPLVLIHGLFGLARTFYVLQVTIFYNFINIFS